MVRQSNVPWPQAAPMSLYDLNSSKQSWYWILFSSKLSLSTNKVIVVIQAILRVFSTGNLMETGDVVEGQFIVSPWRFNWWRFFGNHGHYAREGSGRPNLLYKPSRALCEILKVYAREEKLRHRRRSKSKGSGCVLRQKMFKFRISEISSPVFSVNINEGKCSK